MKIKDYFPHESYYPCQEFIIDTLDKYIDECDWFLLEAPPGTGKSAIARAVADYFGEADILTQLIRLQNQYVEEYNFKKVEGRSHVDCKQNNLDCAQGLCITRDYNCNLKPTPRAIKEREGENYPAGMSKKRGQLYWNNPEKRCNYWDQKMDALNSHKVVHNYAYYLYETNYAGDFGSPPIIIADECHNIEGNVMEFVKVEVTDKNVKRIFDDESATIPNFDTTEEWMAYFKDLINMHIPDRIQQYERKLSLIEEIRKGKSGVEILEIVFDEDIKELRKDGGRISREQISVDFRNAEVDRKEIVLKKRVATLEGIRNKINLFLNDMKVEAGGSWIIIPQITKSEDRDSKVVVRPIFVNNFAEDIMFKDTKKHLLMSGTILNFETLARSIGIDKKPYLGIPIPSPFPVENRLIYKANVGNLKASALNPKNNDNLIKDVVGAIDEILSAPDFKDVKGIIHTTSYAVADIIKKHSKFSESGRMLFHSNSFEAGKVLEKHGETSKPTIIVSPSMREGVNLVDDLSRIQICVGVPYPNIGDPVIKSRADVDPAWYYWRTGISLFQELGRSNRNMEDHSTSIILDNRVSHFLSKQLGYDSTPAWITDSIRSKAELCSKFGLELNYG